MNNIKADTDKMEILVSKFNDCVKIYNQSIEDFFNYMIKNTAWVGNDSEEYKALCASDKPNYVEYGQSLLSLKNSLEDVTDLLKKTVKSSGGNR